MTRLTPLPAWLSLKPEELRTIAEDEQDARDADQAAAERAWEHTPRGELYG